MAGVVVGSACAGIGIMNGYSRALMGFDFADASALLAARRKFAGYLAENGIDRDQAESDADGLNHSWEFATYEFCPTGEGGGIDPTCSPTGETGISEWGGKNLLPESHAETNAWIDTRAKDRSISRNEFLTTDEYKAAYPYLQQLYRAEKLKTAATAVKAMAEVKVNFGDRVGYDYVTPFGVEPYAGEIVSRNGIPYIKLDEGQTTIKGTRSVRWHKGWKKLSSGKSFMLRHMPPWRGLMDMRPGSLHLKIFGKYAELRERRYHLPGQHDQCAHSPTGECQPVESGKGVAGITTVKDRAFRGQPKAVRNVVGKQETGAIGEALALRLIGAKKMNGKWNNFPLDLVKGDTVYEVKAGLVSNRADAQKWRLTIGEPGPKEKAWLRRASPAAKARWNERKADMIVERKRKVVADLERRLGRKVKMKTLTFIIDPDRKVADMHEFDGVHPVIRWRSGQAAEGYKRTVKYG